MNDVNLSNKWIGKRTIRPDGEDKVTGRAQYAADYSMPGQIYGKVLRSPHAHARILSIDTSKALALPGVKAVVTGKDFVEFPVDKSIMLGIQDMRWMARNVIAREKALFIGHPVAAVAASTLAIARQAIKLIKVEYEVLPWAIEIDDALKPDAPILHDHIKFDGKPSNIASKLEHKLGDIDAGFKDADLVIERSFSTRPIHQGYIEPHACVVSVGQDGHTVIWSSSQGQFMVRAMCAYLNDLDQSQIRAIPAEIGGGFGGKTIVYLEPLALELSRKSGRAVKMTMTREEVFHASGPTSGSQSTVQDRRHEGRQDRRRPRHVLPAVRRLPRRTDPRRGWLRVCALRHRQRAFDGLSTSSRTGRKSPPTAARALRSVPMPSSACWTKSRRS